MADDVLTQGKHMQFQCAEMLTSQKRFEGKMNYTAAPDSAPYGELNAGRWFKKVARPMV